MIACCTQIHTNKMSQNSFLARDIDLWELAGADPTKYVSCCVCLVLRAAPDPRHSAARDWRISTLGRMACTSCVCIERR